MPEMSMAAGVAGKAGEDCEGASNDGGASGGGGGAGGDRDGPSNDGGGGLGHIHEL